MSRPKLLFVVTEDWYFVSHCLPLAIAARDAGFEVVVATRVGHCAQAIRDAGLRLVSLNLSRRGGNPLREIAALASLYRRERPDIVHHVAMKPVVYGMVAARLAGQPQQVNAIAGLGWLFTRRGVAAVALRFIVRRLLNWLLDHPNTRTIVQNPDDWALLRVNGLSEDRLRLIRGAGVDTQAFAPGDIPPTPVTVMLVARMLWDKGVGEFVEAAGILAGEGLAARFVLVGDADPGNPTSIPEAVLQGWQGRHGVEWWGRREDMPEVLRQAHVACLPSYREGLPKSLLEAASCGLPIVTTDAPGCREVVRDGDNGLLVPLRDGRALADAMRRLIQDAELRRRMGARGRARVLEEFSQEQVTLATLGVYRELLA